jgi:hypothetical protein
MFLLVRWQPIRRFCGYHQDKFVRRTKERHEMTPEERMDSDLTDMRCLWLCIALLDSTLPSPTHS